MMMKMMTTKTDEGDVLLKVRMIEDYEKHWNSEEEKASGDASWWFCLLLQLVCDDAKSEETNGGRWWFPLEKQIIDWGCSVAAGQTGSSAPFLSKL